MSPDHKNDLAKHTRNAFIAMLAVNALCGDRARTQQHPQDYERLASLEHSVTIKDGSSKTASSQIEQQVRNNQATVERLLDRLPHELHTNSPEDIKKILDALYDTQLSSQWSQRIKTILRNTLIDNDMSLVSRLTIASYLYQHPSEKNNITTFLLSTPSKLEPHTELLRISLAAKLVENGIIDASAIRAFVPSMKACLVHYRLQSPECEVVYNQDLVHTIGVLKQPELQAEVISYLQSFSFSNLSKHEDGLVSQLICTSYGVSSLNFYDDSIRQFIYQGISHCLEKGQYQIQSKFVLGDEFPAFIINKSEALLPILSAQDTASYINGVSELLYAVGAEAGNEFLYSTYSKHLMRNPARMNDPEVQETFFEILIEHQDVLSPKLKECLAAASQDQKILANTAHLFAEYFYRHGRHDVLSSWMQSSDEARWEPALRQLSQSDQGIEFLLDYAMKESAALKRDAILYRLNQAHLSESLPNKQKEKIAKLFTLIADPHDFPHLAKQAGITLPPYTKAEIKNFFKSTSEFDQEIAFDIALRQQSPVLLPDAIKIAGQLSQSNKDVPNYILKYLIEVGGASHRALTKSILLKQGILSHAQRMQSILGKRSTEAYQTYITPFLSSPFDEEQIAAAIALYQGGQTKNPAVMKTFRNHVRYAQDINYEACEILIQEKDPALLMRILEDGRLSSAALHGIIDLLHTNFQTPSFRHTLLEKFKALADQAPDEQKNAILSYHAALTKAHTLGIRLPFRFTPEQLQHILTNNERLLRGLPFSSSRPVTGLVIATEDWNGAFNTIGDELELVFRHTEVYASDVSNDTQALTFLNRVGIDRKGLDLIIIAGHGSRGMLSFSESDPRLTQVNQSTKTLDISDREKIARYLQPAVKPGSTCLLLSCSVGSEKSSSKQSLDKGITKQGFSINLVEATAAGMPGVSTYGAIKPISTGDINFIYQQGRLQSIGPQSILYKVQSQK